MNEDFRNFCSAHDIRPEVLLGESPAHDGQFDAYSLAGSGRVTGIELERYGEFGNNIIQLMHAVYAARRLGLSWIRAKSLASMFDAGVYVLSDGLRLIIGSDAEPAAGSALRGRFFFWWGTGGMLRGISPAEAVEIIQSDLHRCIKLPTAPVTREVPTIHVHIRGGSDIFGASGRPLGATGKLNAGYVQPPLSYYLKVLHSWFSENENGHVVIVSMDRSNPCVDGIERILIDSGRSFSWQSGTVEEDVAALYSSTALVAGWGTFLPMIALLSKSVRRIYFFRDPQHAPRLQAAGVEVTTVIDDCGKYLARGDWSNTAEELSTMLTYPIDCLSLTSS